MSVGKKNRSVTNEQIAAMIAKSASEAFQTMLNMELESLPFRTTSRAPATRDGVLSLIGFSGVWSGAGAVSYSVPMACRIAESLLKTSYKGIDAEVLDAAGEMTNIIVGNVKCQLEVSLGSMLLGIPTIIHGRDFSAQVFGRREWLLAPFSWEKERIDIQLFLAHTPETHLTNSGFDLLSV